MENASLVGLSRQIALQRELDVVANNIANLNTTGFKASHPQFQDLLYDTTRSAGSQQGGGNELPSSLQVGQGMIGDHEMVREVLLR